MFQRFRLLLQIVSLVLACSSMLLQTDKAFETLQFCSVEGLSSHCITGKTVIPRSAFTDTFQVSYTQGDKLSECDLRLLSANGTEISILLSQKTNFSYFFIALECSVAYSDAARLVDQIDFEYLLNSAPTTHFVFVTDTSQKDCLQGSDFDLKYTALSSANQSFFQFLAPIEDIAVNEYDNAVIVDWMASWGSSNHPTLSLILSDTQEVELRTLGLYFPAYDASGTTGWDDASALNTPSSISCADAMGSNGDADSGICGLLSFVGDACATINASVYPYPTSQDLNNSETGSSGLTIAFIARGMCPFTDKARNAQQAGYGAAVIYDTYGTKTTMSGSANDITIPVIMVDEETGDTVLTLLQNTTDGNDGLVSARLFTRSDLSPVTSLDAGEGLMRQLGRAWSSDMNVVIVSQAQYQNYRQGIEAARTAVIDDDLCENITVIPTEQWFDERVVYLPEGLIYAPLDRMYVYHIADCNGGDDITCPEWDVLQPITMCIANVSTIAEKRATCLDDSPPIELVRTITSYRRRLGGFLDVSPLLYFIANMRQKYGFQNLPPLLLYSGGNYIFTVELFICRSAASGSNPVASAGMPLWSGMDRYDAGYNERNGIFNYSLPHDAKVVQVSAYITGHGWGREYENCAEFCPHTHNFTVSNSTNTLPYRYGNDIRFHIGFPEAGTETGCVEQIYKGVTANQYGTWYYGRGGWCPGQAIPLSLWTMQVVTNSSDGADAMRLYDTTGDHTVDGDSERSSSLSLGADNMFFISYESFLFDQVYHPRPSNESVGFAAEMRRSVYVTVKSTPYPPPNTRIVFNNDTGTPLLDITWAWEEKMTMAEFVLVRVYVNMHSTEAPSPRDLYLYDTSTVQLYFDQVLLNSAFSSVSIPIVGDSLNQSLYLGAEVYSLTSAGAGEPSGMYGISLVATDDDDNYTHHISANNAHNKGLPTWIIVVISMLVTGTMIGCLVIGVKLKRKRLLESDRLKMIGDDEGVSVL